MARKRPKSKHRRVERKAAPKPRPRPESVAASTYREALEFAKGGLNMLVWWFNPDSGERYINPSPESVEELEAACRKLRTMGQWLRDIASQLEAKLSADSK